jgi:predicted amidohydrolase
MMRIAVYQNDGTIEDPRGQIERLAETAARLSGTADLLVCSELFLTGYNIGAAAIAELAETRDGASARAIMRIAQSAGMSIVCGFPERDGEQLYNAALCVDRTGELLACHRKLYLPNAYEQSAFVPGDAFTLFRLGEVVVGVLICFDVEFPEAVRGCALRGAELVVAPTALKKEWAWLATSLTRVRAFENGIYLAYANHAGTENDWDYCGLSCIVGPDGHDRARAGATDAVILAEISRTEVVTARATLPYLQLLRSEMG